MLSPTTLFDLNRETAAIPIAEARLPAVALELAQLAAAAEAVRARLDFDAEPAGFLRALDAFAP